MRDERDRPVGRWPWGLWFGLGGLSAGTVAAFAVSGWVFLAATDAYDGPLAVPPPDLSTERLVIESEPAAPPDEDAEEAPAEERALPIPEMRSAVRPVAEQAQEPPEAPRPEPPREPEAPRPAPPEPPEPSPVEEHGELVPVDPGDDDCDHGGHGDADRDGEPRLIIEIEIRVPLSPKE